MDFKKDTKTTVTAQAGKFSVSNTDGKTYLHGEFRGLVIDDSELPILADLLRDLLAEINP